MKNELIDKVCMSLLKRGFAVKCLPRKWFDILARNSERILIIKVLNDANSISPELAGEMLKICSFLSGTPMVIAEKAGEPLEDGVVYSRFGVYSFNYNTFRSCLENRFPIVVSSRAGFTASVSGEKLRREREAGGFSLGALSRKVGVSRRMIAKYESNAADVSFRSALALNRIFGSGIFNKVDVFGAVKGAFAGQQSEIARKYGELGFRASDMKKVPFDVVARLQKELILTEVSPRSANPNLVPIQHLLGADALVILDGKSDSDKAKKKLPSLQKIDFLDMKSAQELIRFLREFD